MPTNADSADTPYYVLMEGNRRIGPEVAPLRSGIKCSPIYGFSNKHAYDKFCMNSRLQLSPYPLVKSFLRDEVNTSGNGMKLIVLEAIGPEEPDLRAATIEDVLESHEKRKSQVTLKYLLTFNRETNAYLLVEAPE